MPTKEEASKYADELLELINDETKKPPVDDPALLTALLAMADIANAAFRAYGMARWLHDKKLPASIGPQAFIPSTGPKP